jgi:putative membrane-bound dehydrogenase-like protein
MEACASGIFCAHNKCGAVGGGGVRYRAIMRALAALGLTVVLGGCGRHGPPYSPKEALQTFKIESGFRVETFVSEPEIRSPVAMEFDEDGRIYVVEDPGYPLDTESRLGRVILLEDTNGDGLPDRGSVFAEKLVMPTGVMRWKKGILVTDAPNVWYFEDTDGDGKADVKKIVLTGFAFTNPQHTVNNPMYGLDNWIYLAHEGPATAVIFTDKFGDRGGDIRFPDRPDAPSLKPERRNVRFRPDTYQLEYLSGSSQFGQTFDEWGHHFTTNNSDHIREEVAPARYIERNPDLLARPAMRSISDHGAAAEVYPITRHAQFQMLTNAGEFTSACGVTIYLGGAFPPSLGLFALVAEPAHDLVHRDILMPSGAAYIARRAHEGAEFLASTDSWFRPVNFYIGPDGAIYMLDFYRPIIEHPEWMATETYHSKNLYKGQDRGRIYRIVPEPTLPRPRNIRLGQASDEELVRQLANPNIWWRRTAQRLLVDRRSAGAVAALVRLFETSPSPAARLHALWTLDGLEKLDTGLIEKALHDPEAGIRENAILLAEARLPQFPALSGELLNMERDPNPRVQFQLLCTLGSIHSPASRAAQNRMLVQNIEDPWMQLAALSASPDRAPQLFQAARAFTGRQTEARTNFFREVSAVIGAGQKPEEIGRVLEAVARSSKPEASWWRAASLEGLAMGLRGRHAKLDAGRDLLVRMFEEPDKPVRRACLQVLAAVGLPKSPAALAAEKRAETAAADQAADPDLRADSIALLSLANPAGQREDLFKRLINPKEPEPVQAAAVRALGRMKGEEVGAYLLKNWRAMTPAVRTEAADALLAEPGRQKLFVQAIKDEQVQPWTLSFRQKSRLMMSRDPEIRDSARLLLQAKTGEREKVLRRYEAALDRDGDARKGRQVFERACAKCHRLNGIGHEVGPDLASIRNRPAQFILPDIIMPNRSIAQNYESYVVETKSGGTIEGVMGPQTPTTITIRHEEGKQDVIRREDIKEMRVTNLSAMPEDLDKQVSVDEMADLLKFLKTAR